MNTPILTQQFLDFKLFHLPERATEKSLGHYSLLILVKEEGYGESEVSLLQKILSAVEFDLNKDALLLKSKSESFHHLKSAYDIKAVVSFGVPLRSVGLNFETKPYQPIEYQEMKFLLAESLPTIAVDKSRKATLWKALKAMFQNRV